MIHIQRIRPVTGRDTLPATQAGARGNEGNEARREMSKIHDRLPSWLSPLYELFASMPWRVVPQQLMQLQLEAHRQFVRNDPFGQLARLYCAMHW